MIDDRCAVVLWTHLARSAQMIGRQSGLPSKIQAIGITDNRGAGQFFCVVVGLNRWRPQHSPQRANSIDNYPLVLFVHKIVGLNDRSTGRISRAGADKSIALRAKLVEPDLNDRKSFQRKIRIVSEGNV